MSQIAHADQFQGVELPTMDDDRRNQDHAHEDHRP